MGILGPPRPQLFSLSRATGRNGFSNPRSAGSVARIENGGEEIEFTTCGDEEGNGGSGIEG